MFGTGEQVEQRSEEVIREGETGVANLRNARHENFRTKFETRCKHNPTETGINLRLKGFQWPRGPPKPGFAEVILGPARASLACLFQGNS